MSADIGTRRRMICFVGGEDLSLRMPFFLALLEKQVEFYAVGSEAPEKFEAHGIRYFQCPLERFVSPLSDVRTILALSKIFRTELPSIVHGFDTKPAIFAVIAARIAGVRAAMRTVTGLGQLFSNNSLRERILRIPYYVLQKIAGIFADLTVFQNPDDHTLFIDRKLVSASKSLVIYGSGISLDVVDETAEAITAAVLADLKAELDCEEKTIVLMVARLVSFKGVEDFLDASDMVDSDDFQFVLVGPTSGEGKLAVPVGRVEQARNVQYLGSRSDVLAIMTISDVVVLPSFYREGVPRVLLEAASIGVPIVTTDTPGCKEAVIPGETGWLVEAKKPEQLAIAIEYAGSLESEQRQELALKSRNLIRNKFDLGLVIAQYMECYTSLTRPSE